MNRSKKNRNTILLTGNRRLVQQGQLLWELYGLPVVGPLRGLVPQEEL